MPEEEAGPLLTARDLRELELEGWTERDGWVVKRTGDGLYTIFPWPKKLYKALPYSVF